MVALRIVVKLNLISQSAYLILEKIIHLGNLANIYMETKAPWGLKKDGKIEEMNNVLYVAAEIVRKIAILLLAFTPKSANKILDLFNIFRINFILIYNFSFSFSFSIYNKFSKN